MKGVAAGGARGGDDAVAAQVGLRWLGWPNWHGGVGHPNVQGAGVCVGINRRRTDAHLATGVNDAHGDLATLGDEERRVFHSEEEIGRRLR